jgi:hypothetical protein
MKRKEMAMTWISQWWALWTRVAGPLARTTLL